MVWVLIGLMVFFESKVKRNVQVASHSQRSNKDAQFTFLDMLWLKKEVTLTSIIKLTSTMVCDG